MGHSVLAYVDGRSRLARKCAKAVVSVADPQARGRPGEDRSQTQQQTTTGGNPGGALWGEESAAQDHVHSLVVQGLAKHGDLFGHHLTIAIESHDLPGAAAQGVLDSGLQSRTLAKVHGMSDIVGAQAQQLGQDTVGGAVVDHDDVRGHLQGRRDHLANDPGFVVTGDHYPDLSAGQQVASFYRHPIGFAACSALPSAEALR